MIYYLTDDKKYYLKKVIPFFCFLPGSTVYGDKDKMMQDRIRDALRAIYWNAGEIFWYSFAVEDNRLKLKVSILFVELDKETQAQRAALLDVPEISDDLLPNIQASSYIRHTPEWLWDHRKEIHQQYKFGEQCSNQLTPEQKVKLITHFENFIAVAYHHYDFNTDEFNTLVGDNGECNGEGVDVVFNLGDEWQYLMENND